MDEMTNAQGWELEIVCKNIEYKKAVIKMLSKEKMDFSVRYVDNDRLEDRWVIFISCCWFHNLAHIAKKLEIIERGIDFP